MCATRFQASILAVGALLFGGACSSSSDNHKDAAPVLDVRADGPTPLDSAMDRVVADSPLLMADTGFQEFRVGGMICAALLYKDLRKRD